MSSRSGEKNVDLWSQIVESEPPEPKIGVVYTRRRPETTSEVANNTNLLNLNHWNRKSIAPAAFGEKRVSWNRSLSTRGRTSVSVAAWVECLPQQTRAKRKAKPPIPKGKSGQSLNFDRERAYFKEVDSFELMEESPSPKNFGTWMMGNKMDDRNIPHISSVLERWLISKRLNYSGGSSGSLFKLLETPPVPMEPICNNGLDYSRSLFKILETPAVPVEPICSDGLDYSEPLFKILESPDVPMEPICGNDLDYSKLKTPEKAFSLTHSAIYSLQKRYSLYVMNKDNLSKKDTCETHLRSQKCHEDTMRDDDVTEDIEVRVRKLSLTSCWDPFLALLTFCRQSAPLLFLDVLTTFCELESIVKVGEGTFGEAFKTGKTVCKIVPVGGDIKVNGSEQKKSEELLEEVILSQTLNHLRSQGDHIDNSCTTFIDTVGFAVCQGPYHPALIKAWEAWDVKYSSENDHPKGFPKNQCYVLLVQEHGGQDLESFVLMNYDEAQSLIVQVSVALAVAEAAFEFEHRDLHWGNVLLSRKESETLLFILEGKHIHVETNGLFISIIDFTLSRINTGEDILYLDLSLDPELFEGPKGDRQSDTYRKMKDITEDCWEGSFPKTNVAWLQYLVDIVLLKKSFKRTSKDERELRSFKKRLNTYNSAKEAISDPFIKDLFVDPDA